MVDRYGRQQVWVIHQGSYAVVADDEVLNGSIQLAIEKFGWQDAVVRRTARHVRFEVPYGDRTVVELEARESPVYTEPVLMG
jgi:hypothetical protein